MWSLPNILTMARALAVLPVAGCVLGRLWWWAFAIFAVAALTDFLDGWLARRWSQTSEFGRFLDPIADKLMVAGALVAMVAAGLIAGMGVWAVVLILTRELFVSGLREFLGPKGIVVHVSALAKWKTTLQLLAIALLLLKRPVTIGWGADSGVPVAMAGARMLWIAAIISWVTAADYLKAALPAMARR